MCTVFLCGIILMVPKAQRHGRGAPGGRVGTSSLSQNVVPSRNRAIH